MARIVNCFVSQFQFAIENSIKYKLLRYEGRFIMFDLLLLRIYIVVDLARNVEIYRQCGFPHRTCL